MNFALFKEENYRFIPFCKRLQTYFNEENIHNFRLVPIFSLGRKHLMYTNTCLGELKHALTKKENESSNVSKQKRKPTRTKVEIEIEKEEAKNRKEKTVEKEKKRERLKQLKKKIKIMPSISENEEEICEIGKEIAELNKFFKEEGIKKEDIAVKHADKYCRNKERVEDWFQISSIRTKDLEFSETFNTNVIDVSIIFNKKRKATSKSDSKSSKKVYSLVTHSNSSSNDFTYKRFVGLDPGKKHMLVGVSRINDPNP